MYSWWSARSLRFVSFAPWLASTLIMLVLPVVVLSLALIVGCKRGGEGSAPSGNAKVKVQLNWVAEPEFGGIYAARDIGAYGRAGLDVEINAGGPSSPVVQLVANGQTDFGVVAAEDVVIARARGAGVIAVFATFQTSPQAVMVHASRGLKSLDELRSGTLAVEPGATFVAFLKKKHAFTGVTIVPNDGGVAKFVNDKNYAQQCYVTSEPLAAKKLGSDPQVFLAADSGFNPYQSVIVTRPSVLSEKPAMVKSFVAATIEGWRAYLKDPKSANAIMGKLNTSMDAETFAAAAAAQKPLIENDETKEHGLGTMTRRRWIDLATQMLDLGLVPFSPPAEQCFSPDALPASK